VKPKHITKERRRQKRRKVKWRKRRRRRRIKSPEHFLGPGTRPHSKAGVSQNVVYAYGLSHALFYSPLAMQRVITFLGRTIQKTACKLMKLSNYYFKI
jgi:hypothetical protein